LALMSSSPTALEKKTPFPLSDEHLFLSLANTGDNHSGRSRRNRRPGSGSMARGRLRRWPWSARRPGSVLTEAAEGSVPRESLDGGHGGLGSGEGERTRSSSAAAREGATGKMVQPHFSQTEKWLIPHAEPNKEIGYPQPGG
jgi:hypothetical protein